MTDNPLRVMGMGEQGVCSSHAVVGRQKGREQLTIADTWQPNTDRRVYTHISASGASRLDRMYVTKELNSRKRGVEVVAAAFADHLAACVRLSPEFPILRTGRGMWKMDNDVLIEITGTNKMRTLWKRPQRHKRSYPDTTMWWDRSCKTTIRRFFQHEQAGRRREQRIMENHLYECIYDVLQLDPSSQNIRSILNRLQGKIIWLHSIRMQRLLLDTEEADRLECERPTLYHTLKMKWRRSQRTIHYLRDENGQL